MIEKSKIQDVRNSFNSILRADYISISEINQLKELDNYYVDFLKNIPKILQNQDSYINGRRGTGKTTLLMRAYYECLKTISPVVKEKSTILGNKRVLPIYIDLSQCKDIFADGNYESFERSFILKLIEDFRNQLYVMFAESKLKFFKTNYAEIETFEEVIKLIQEGMLIKTSNSKVKEEDTIEGKTEFEGNISITDLSVAARESSSELHKTERETEFIRNCNVQSFLSYLGQIRKQSSLDAIYVFVDEFSDLSDEEQAKFSILLKKLLGSKNNIFFKVGTITDRFYFGETIIVGRDIYPISLDLSDFVERYGGIVQASKELQKYTEKLIKKRLDTFAPAVLFSDVFKGDKDTIMNRISKEAMGVSRTIGLILQNALIQAETKSDNSIQLNEINIGIRETRKIYFKQFQGAVQKRAISGFYMDMWNSLLKRVLNEKNKNSSRPASHFMIDPIRKKYLNVFCENFMVHYLEDNRASKYGGNYVLYAIDYDICNENNVLFANEKDEFSAARFIYDSVFQEYDGYFVKGRIKSYKCPSCNAIYEEAEVAKMKKVKRCFECDEKLIEIIHKEVPVTAGNYTELEVKILGLIATLKKDEAMTATEIGDAVGCNYQKVALWCSRVLGKNNLIEIEKRGSKNYYYDKAETSEDNNEN